MQSFTRTGLNRLKAALFTWPSAADWAGCALIALVYLAIAALIYDPEMIPKLPAGDRPWPAVLGALAGLLIVPALGEELLFRGLLVPREDESMPPLYRLAQLLGALALFVLWHPFQASTWSLDRTEFLDGSVLGNIALFGVAATFLYTYSQSLWPAVLLHWLVVAAEYAIAIS